MVPFFYSIQKSEVNRQFGNFFLTYAQLTSFLFESWLFGSFLGPFENVSVSLSDSSGFIACCVPDYYPLCLTCLCGIPNLLVGSTSGKTFVPH